MSFSTRERKRRYAILWDRKWAIANATRDPAVLDQVLDILAPALLPNTLVRRLVSCVAGIRDVPPYVL